MTVTREGSAVAAGTEEQAAADPGQVRRRRPLAWSTLGVVVVATAATAFWALTGGGGESADAKSSGPVATETVARDTIAETEAFDGTLTHGEPFTVRIAGAAATGEPSTSSTAGSGTITRLAGAGTEVGRGTELYRVDEQPTVALIGDIPMYRDLRSGDTGPDVRQLERNLKRLGYGGFTVDNEFTSSTADAVYRWQQDLGTDVTGAVLVSDIVFVPAVGRVDTVHLDVGDRVQAGAEVLDLTGAEDVASLEVEVGDRDLFAVGTTVTLVLADGEEVRGDVTRSDVVAVDAEGAAGGSASTSPADDAITEVEVTLKENVDEGLAGSPVDVVVDIETRENVLVVPVTALLALAEGGYGLEVVGDDGTTAIVAVDAGIFAGGLVEVSGAGIAEGTVVGVAGR